MSSPVRIGTLDPITRASAWHKFKLQGVDSPGTIPRGGMRGFKRETGWDIKRGKGTRGATLTLKDQPPCEGTIALQLFEPDDFTAWDNFVGGVLSITPTAQRSDGLSIYHPALGSIGLTAVVVKYYTPPEHHGKGLYIATIELIEWSLPPPVSIVSTPTHKAGDLSGFLDFVPGGKPPDQLTKQLTYANAMKESQLALLHGARPSQ
jgi:hypothetical protein